MHSSVLEGATVLTSMTRMPLPLEDATGLTIHNAFYKELTVAIIIPCLALLHAQTVYTLLVTQSSLERNQSADHQMSIACVPNSCTCDPCESFHKILGNDSLFEIYQVIVYILPYSVRFLK